MLSRWLHSSPKGIFITSSYMAQQTHHISDSISKVLLFHFRWALSCEWYLNYSDSQALLQRANCDYWLPPRSQICGMECCVTSLFSIAKSIVSFVMLWHSPDLCKWGGSNFTMLIQSFQKSYLWAHNFMLWLCRIQMRAMFCFLPFPQTFSISSTNRNITKLHCSYPV